MGAGNSTDKIKSGCNIILNQEVCEGVFKGVEKLQIELKSQGLSIPTPKPTITGPAVMLATWIYEMDSFIKKNSNALNFLDKLESYPSYKSILAKVNASNALLPQNPIIADKIAKIIIYGQQQSATGRGEESESFKEIVGAGVGAMVCMDITNVILVIIILILTYMIVKELGYIEAYIHSNEENMTPYRPLIAS